MESELSRIGVSIPVDLLSRFDEIMHQTGYSSRSEGIRDSIKSYIKYYEWVCEVKGERVGIISVIYNPSQHGISEKFSSIKYSYPEILISTSSIYISEREILEVIILQGNAEEIKLFNENIMAQKGVKYVRLSTIELTND
ncbi:transcriptional regulator NikR, CopG family [Methanosalsum zhilinae DSM 4017]|uniref:Putative nickel-responsive regulator n=1 Tax=Methanosalsum zhilinae (strain DSM 4017 / NBRC 107636 / OCM 62 / WeN5) TaxID=679901 RepID=F7XN10_METZD|nr:nickel-responsive transcriptional regulator NikR [Methanosalsum zhilinae]AEH61119.1 transcriptional regulator NikR, CopG family [Methanosalsum zhilinae DSM 4017]